MNPLSLLCLIPFVAGVPQYFYAPQRVAYNTFSGYPNRVAAYQNTPKIKSFVNFGNGLTKNYNSGYSNIANTGANIGYPKQVASYQYPAKIPSFGNEKAFSLNQNVYNGDIVADTRALSNQAQKTLRDLASKPTTLAIVNSIINESNSICVKDLEEGIAGIESATQLLENNGNEINNLVAKLRSMGTLTDAASVVRDVAEIIRIAEPLSNKLPKGNNLDCAASFANELSFTNQLPLSFDGRNQLKNSATTITAFKTLLTQLKSTFMKFSESCTADGKFNIESIRSVGDIITDSARAFETLGGLQKGVDASKGKQYVNKVVVGYSITLFNF